MRTKIEKNSVCLTVNSNEWSKISKTKIVHLPYSEKITVGTKIEITCKQTGTYTTYHIHMIYGMKHYTKVELR